MSTVRAECPGQTLCDAGKARLLPKVGMVPADWSVLPEGKEPPAFEHRVVWAVSWVRVTATGPVTYTLLGTRLAVL